MASSGRLAGVGRRPGTVDSLKKIGISVSVGWSGTRVLDNMQLISLSVDLREIVSQPSLTKQLYWTNFLGTIQVFYDQEPPSGESTTTECGVNYQLLAVTTVVAQFETPRCSQPQPATDNDVRYGRSNWLVAPPTLMGSTSWAPRA